MNFKQILTLLLVLAGVLSLTGCTQEQTESTYTVYVVDEDGNPVTGGMVQFCLDTCTPVALDEAGRAVLTADAADYEVKMLAMPQGYTYATGEEVFRFAPGSFELNIVLKRGE